MNKLYLIKVEIIHNPRCSQQKANIYNFIKWFIMVLDYENIFFHNGTISKDMGNKYTPRVTQSCTGKIKTKNVLNSYMHLPPHLRAGYGIRSVFKWSFTVWIHSFPSSRLVVIPKLESLSYYLTGEKIVGCIPFPSILVLFKMQTASSRILTPSLFLITIIIMPIALPEQTKWKTYIWLRHLTFRTCRMLSSSLLRNFFIDSKIPRHIFLIWDRSRGTLKH